MKAFTVEKYGDRAGMRAAEVPDPQVGADDVLVKIHAAGVNPLDLRIRNGDFRTLMPYRLPLVLGNDLAGEVLRVGTSVTRFAVGDEVYARPGKDRIGTFAELIAVHQDDLAPKPAALTMTEAASLPLVALTAWQALVERARVRPGQRVLIHAGAGGLGSIAVQLAKALGAHVATTASTGNVDLVKELGADVAVDHRTQDFTDLLDGYDVVLDSLGGDNLARSLRVLKPGGQVISVAGPPDPAFASEIGANPLLRLAMTALSFRTRRSAKRRGVTYSFLFMKASGAQLRELTALIDAGKIRPVVDRVFPFDETLHAMEYVEKGRAKAGKVVVAMAWPGGEKAVPVDTRGGRLTP
ncbi:NADP-dependent oxidoreductase [Streptomyces sp. NPDC060030]|uniref:NADP-dependent oxidoreductase n=1 Tax=Streptomyces sp. NPDC060030 TaxID=3347042 RepID=UPI0036A2ADDD